MAAAVRQAHVERMTPHVTAPTSVVIGGVIQSSLEHSGRSEPLSCRATKWVRRPTSTRHPGFGSGKERDVVKHSRCQTTLVLHVSVNMGSGVSSTTTPTGCDLVFGRATATARLAPHPRTQSMLKPNSVLPKTGVLPASCRRCGVSNCQGRLAHQAVTPIWRSLLVRLMALRLSEILEHDDSHLSNTDPRGLLAFHDPHKTALKGVAD